jgi:hypothetical protein
MFLAAKITASSKSRKAGKRALRYVLLARGAVILAGLVTPEFVSGLAIKLLAY